jgi:YVTN family beta-propeller protein
MNSSQQAERLTSLLKRARMSGRISPAGQNFRRQRIFYLMFWLLGTALILSSRLAYGGQYAYVANSNTSEVSVIDLSTGQVVATPNVTAGPIAVTISANQQSVYVTSGNNKTSVVSVISTATNQVVSSYPLNPEVNSPYGIAVTPDGGYAYIANDANGTVTVINTMTGVVLQNIAVGKLPVGVSITPDDQYVYVTNLGDSSVSVIATANNTVIKTIRIGDLSRPSLIGSGPFSLGSFIGPNIIVPNGGPLLLPSDWIDQLYVLPGLQRRGVGTALLDIARSTYSSLHAWTFQRNAVARSFYESRKFLKTKETDGSDNAEKEPDILYFWSRGS